VRTPSYPGKRSNDILKPFPVKNLRCSTPFSVWSNATSKNFTCLVTEIFTPSNTKGSGFSNFFLRLVNTDDNDTDLDL